MEIESVELNSDNKRKLEGKWKCEISPFMRHYNGINNTIMISHVNGKIRNVTGKVFSGGLLKRIWRRYLQRIVNKLNMW